MDELRAIICYRRSSPNQRGRVGDFIELPEHGELAYKGRLYGLDDIADFNRDAKILTTDRRFFSPPYVKMVKVSLEVKKKHVSAPKKVEQEEVTQEEVTQEEVTQEETTQEEVTQEEVTQEETTSTKRPYKRTAAKAKQ